MKKFFFILISTAFLFSNCYAKKIIVSVKNSISLQRNNEMVQLDFKKISSKLHLKGGETFVVKDAEGKQVPYQLTYDNSVIFPVNVKANSTSIFTIQNGKPEKFAAKTFGRFVPERKDDFTWENDRIAFRMYGPKLAPENPSNGVDVWLKKTNELIVDSFYYNDLVKEKPYHIDRGKGLDCYKVAHTLGAGGIAPYADTTLWVGNNYNHWQVIENGPLRTTFQLTYDSVQVGNVWLKESYIVSLDAGSQLNKATVFYDGNIPANMKLAVGIFLHDGKGITKSDVKAGYIGYGEIATSDLGVPAGHDYVGAVILDDKILSVKIQDAHLLALVNYEGKSFTYYFGAGWNQWGFPDDKAWFNYLNDFSIKLKKPLIVTIK